MNPHNLATQIQFRIKPGQAGAVANQGTAIAGPGLTSKNANFNIANCGFTYQARLRYQCEPSVFSPWKFRNSIPTSCSNKQTSGLTNEVEIYPNPASDNLMMVYRSVFEEEVGIRIYDMVGKTYRNEERQMHEGENLVTFNVEGLQSGVYFLEVQSLTGKVVKEFVVAK